MVGIFKDGVQVIERSAKEVEGGKEKGTRTEKGQIRNGE